MLGLERKIYMTHSFDNEAVSSAFDSILSQKDIAGRSVGNIVACMGTFKLNHIPSIHMVYLR